MQTPHVAPLTLASLTLLAVACGGKAVVEPPLPTGAGGSGGAGTTTAISATSANTETSMTSSTSVCADLDAQYAMTLEEAKACNPMANLECSVFVADSITACCPNQVAINAQATEQAKRLAQLRAAAGQAGCLSPCDDGECPLPDPTPSIGSCDATTSRCQTSEGLPD
jgi:hypothetical protein